MSKNESINDRAVILSIMEILFNTNLGVVSQHTAIKIILELWAVNLKIEINNAETSKR